MLTVHNFFPFAEATPTFLGIELSNTCLTQIKNHLNTTCPTYKDLERFDQSIQAVSGKFVDTPYTHRATSSYKSECLYYKYFSKDFLIIVDPSSSMVNTCGAKEIIIDASDFTLISQSDLKKNSTSNLTWQKSRIVDNCYLAHISYSSFLLTDTISYIKSGCTKTSFNSIVSQSQHETQFDLKGYEYQKQVWFKASKNIKQNCINYKCVTPEDPTKKKGY